MKNTFVTRYRILPVGDKEERDRVYQYYRDAQYNQYLALNQAMSETGALYYNCRRDIKSAEFKEKYKELFKRDSSVFDNIIFPKGGHLQGNVTRKVQSDFSTALKNGLAKGERQLPRYRRDFPYMIHGVELKPYAAEEEYEGKSRTSYFIKTVNKMHLKIVFGSAVRKAYNKVDLIKKLAENDPDYKICQSSLFFKDNKMFLNLVVTKNVDENDYEYVEGRTMGVSYGFASPAIVAFNDSSNTYSLGDGEMFINKRIQMQEHYQRLQKSLRSAGGQHGRKKKLRSLERLKAAERNFANLYNHKLSKQIVDLARDHKVERIVLQQIDTKQVKTHPVMIRNWSYSQLYDKVKYKAEFLNMKAETEIPEDICPHCGCFIKLQEFVSEGMDEHPQSEYCEICPECGEKIDVSRNRAKRLAMSEGKKKTSRKRKKEE